MKKTITILLIGMVMIGCSSQSKSESKINLSTTESAQLESLNGAETSIKI